MNKKIMIGAGIAVLAIVIATIGIKEIAGDSAAEIPGEEHMEKTLNIQEANTTNTTSESGESGSTESSESGP